MLRAILVAVVVLTAVPSFAQATRTWVSAVGDDSAPCSRTNRCGTFATAIAKTVAGGEIDCLDRGGFGPVTITKSITIDCAGQLGGVLTNGTDGVVVAAATTDLVRLRGLSLEGFGTGLAGVKIISAGTVYVDDTSIAGFATGIEELSGGVFSSTNASLAANGTGISIAPQQQPGNVVATIAHASITKCTAGAAIDVVSNARVVIANSVITANTVGAGLTAEQASVDIAVADSVISLNAFGVVAGVGGSAPIVRLTRNMITGNTTAGVLANPPAQVIGFGDNVVDGNAGANAVSTTRNAQ